MQTMSTDQNLLYRTCQSVNAKVGTKAVLNRDRNGLVLARQKYQKENPNKENKPCGSKQ